MSKFGTSADPHKLHQTLTMSKKMKNLNEQAASAAQDDAQDNPFTQAGGGAKPSMEERLAKASKEFDEDRAASAAERGDAPIPMDRLPYHGLIGRPHPASPFWTKRASDQRQWAIENIGHDRIAEAAKILNAADKRFGRDPEGYAGVFEHNAMTLATALLLAEHGFPVVDSHAIRADGQPTNPNDNARKNPRGAAWQLRATTDRDAIIRGWTGHGEYPPNKKGEVWDYASVFAARNASIRTGDDIMVVDLDGEAGLAWLAKREPELPKTPRQRTGSGGAQCIFRLPQDVTIFNTTSKIAPGVDIRGENGQIVAGPSIHPSRNFYQWEDGLAPWQVEIAEAPAWLIEAAQKASSKGKGRTTNRTDYDGVREYVYSDGPRGFDQWLGVIGDGEGQRGFDGPIYSASISYFLAEGTDADDGVLFERLRETIAATYMKPDRPAPERYLSDDDYLWRRIGEGQAAAIAIEEMREDEDDDPPEDHGLKDNSQSGADDREEKAFADEADTSFLDLNTAEEVNEAAAQHLSNGSTEEEVLTFIRRVDVDNVIVSAALPGAVSQAVRALDKPTVKALVKRVKEEREEFLRDLKRKNRKARRKVKPSKYIPLDEATVETVEDAAAHAAWLPDSYEYKDGWYWALDFEKKDKNGDPRMTRVCRAFEVALAGFGEGANGRTNTITIRYPHESKRMGIVESSFKLGDTRGESGKFLGRLRDEGLELVGSASTVMNLFQHVRSDHEGQLFTTSGWRGDTYVSPNGAIVNASEHSVLEDNGVSRATQGTLEEHNAAATTVLTSDVGKWFLPGYLLGAVGCLADYISFDLSPIIFNQGGSTRGKTSSLSAGAAWFAVASSDGLVCTMDNTDFAFESLVARANGAGIVFDEEAGSDRTGNQKQQLFMRVAGGTGRGRGGRDQKLQKANKWTAAAGFSGERDFLEQILADDTDVRTGMVARVFSVDYSTVPEVTDEAVLTAIRQLAGFDSKLPAGVQSIYAVAGPVFAAKLAELGRDAVRSKIAEVQKEWSALSRGPAARLVDVAALLRVAGEIAKDAGIFGQDVPVSSYIEAALTEVLQARERHLNIANQADDRVRSMIRKAIQEGQIIDVADPPQNRFKETLGYYGIFAGNGQIDKKAIREHASKIASAENTGDVDELMDAEAEELSDRQYILPLARIGKLGVTTNVEAWANGLPEGALITRKKGDRHVWYHDNIPTEGSGKCIRLSGAFVHAVGDFAPPDDDGALPDDDGAPPVDDGVTG